MQLLHVCRIIACLRSLKQFTFFIPYFLFIFVKSSLATKLNNRLAGESSVSDNLCKKFKRFRSNSKTYGNQPNCNWHCAMIVLSNVLNSVVYHCKRNINATKLIWVDLGPLDCKLGWDYSLMPLETAPSLHCCKHRSCLAHCVQH